MAKRQCAYTERHNSLRRKFNLFNICTTYAVPVREAGFFVKKLGGMDAALCFSVLYSIRDIVINIMIICLFPWLKVTLPEDVYS